jgi:hypothetical protein
MAQAGFTPIQLYRSTTASAAPTAGNLLDGELALNTTDMKLYAKNTGGTVTLLASPTSGASILYGDGSGGFSNVTVGTGLSFAGGTLSATNAGTVTSVTASAPLASSGGATPNISFTGTLGIANGGTGQTTASAAFNALSPITSTGDLIIGNGVNSATRLGIGANGYVLTSNGTTATWSAAAGGLSLSNDTSTASNLYPLFANATTGTASTAYTSNAKLLYKPSTGELQASEVVASNGIFVNNGTVSSSYTVATGNNGFTVGPVTVASGQSVTISSGQRWVVI